MKKFIPSLFFTLILQICYSQIVIFDTINKSPIPNVSVVLGSNKFTTISDLDGSVLITKELLNNDNTISFSHISYQPKFVKIIYLKQNDTIFLTPIARTLNDVVVSSNTIKDYLVLKGFYRSYLFNDNIVYGYSDGIVEYYINLKKNEVSRNSLSNKIISNRLYVRKFENNVKNNLFIKIGNSVNPSLPIIIKQSLSHIISTIKNNNDTNELTNNIGNSIKVNYDLLKSENNIRNIFGIRIELLKNNSSEEFSDGRLNPLYLKSISNNSRTKISLKSEGYLKGYFSETLQEFYVLKSNYISEETYRKIKTSKSFQIPNSNNIEILMEYKNKFNLPNTPMFIENQIGSGLEMK